MYSYPASMIRSQLRHFPEGQLVALKDDQIVGYCASFRTTREVAFKPHSWWEITGHGAAKTHRPDGEWLYGMEVMVDPSARRQRVGSRLYEARKDLCRRLGLRGIVGCGRMPGLKASGLTAEEYVRSRASADPVLSFQLGQGFVIEGVIADYLPDPDSRDHGAFLVWRGD
jgi:GNAT superfamily N-acetyltransferase